MSEQSGDTIENLKQIDKIAKKNVPMFFMSITHLFDNGMNRFTEDSLAVTMEHLEERHKEAEAQGQTLVMTLEFEKELVQTAYDLAQFPLFDILLYIKKNLNIYDPEDAIPKELTNTYTGEVIGTIEGNLVKTSMGTYEVSDDDLEWLIHEAAKRRNFCARDVKSVGAIKYTD